MHYKFILLFLILFSKIPIKNFLIILSMTIQAQNRQYSGNKISCRCVQTKIRAFSRNIPLFLLKLIRMKINYITILFFLFFTSCGSLTELKMLNREIKGVKYKIKVPKGYEYYECSSIEECMVHLHYSDSSCIYFGSPDITPNYRNIKSVNDSIYLLRFQNVPLAEDVNKALGFKLVTIRPDTLDISGQDSVGLFWRDVIIRDKCIGYKNVKESNKLLFDNAVNSLR